MSPLTPTAPGLPHNDGQGSRPPGQVGRQESLQQPLQEPPLQSPLQSPQQSPLQSPQQPPQQPPQQLLNIEQRQYQH